MDLKQLEAFVHVVDIGSFSKAADKLHLTQPTISAHIHSLEEELGTQLIVRTPRNVYPSMVGKRLYGYAVDMLALRDNALATCRGKADEMCGTILVAASTVPHQYLLPAAMADFRKRYPKVLFKLERYDSAAVAQAVLAGKAELGLTGTAIAHTDLVYTEICHDDLVVITPPTPPYSEIALPTLNLDALLSMPYVVREPGSGTRIETEDLLRAKGVDPAKLNIVAQMDSLDTIKSAVNQGLGISIVSKLSAKNYAKLGLIKVFQLEGEPLRRKLYFVHRKYHPLSAVAQKFSHFLLQE